MAPEIILAIQPKWCELILSGEKILEIRKTFPKEIRLPCTCYLYETQGPTEIPWIDEDGHQIFKGRGQVVGECTIDTGYHYEAEFVNDDICYQGIKKILYEDSEDPDDIEYQFETSNELEDPDRCYLCNKSCLSFNDIRKYVAGGKEGFFDFYAWKLINPIRYKPLSITLFKRWKRKPDREICARLEKPDCYNCSGCRFKRAPQSWAYCQPGGAIWWN